MRLATKHERIAFVLAGQLGPKVGTFCIQAHWRSHPRRCRAHSSISIGEQTNTKSPLLTSIVLDVGTSAPATRSKEMPRYFFHLAGTTPAHDMIGHECADENEAKEHAGFLAHQLGSARPGAVREENVISVRDAWDRELFQVPLASTSV